MTEIAEAETATLSAARSHGRRYAQVSLRTLDLIRWIAIVGQAAAIVTVHVGFGFALPIEEALAVVAASALVNIANLLPRQAGGRLSDREAALYLAFDSIQLAVLLFLTGGLWNPFSILVLAPVTVAATVLSRRSVIFLSALAIAAVTILAVWHRPLPWPEPGPQLPVLYVAGVWTALVLSTVFIAAYTFSVAAGARRLADAFAATQLALAKEQRVSAVGALAAAAAHELGSPLATIAVVAKELVRELPPGSPHAEDAQLLLSQSDRCSAILADLAYRPEADRFAGEHRMPVSALVEAAGAPYRQAGVRVIYATASGEGPEPSVRRSPEIMHGLGNLIQNAIQFARSEVSVTTSWGPDGIHVEIADDGPGFPPQVLARIGEPYVSSRGGAAAHMGLGIFIAQTLLERTGAAAAFDNLPDGGARVAIHWKHGRLDDSETRRPG